MLLLNLIMFSLALGVLIYSASVGIKSLVKLAQGLKVSEFVMAFIIAAIATTLPELFVTINASLIKTGEIVIGNVLGSNLADLGLIGGLVIVFARSISTTNKKIRRDSIWMFLLGILPLLLFFIGKGISRIDGAILIISTLLYIIYIFKIKKEFKKTLKATLKAKEIFFHTVILFVSLALIYFSADYTVKYAQILAIDLKISPLFVALFLIAIGTSLPEFALSIQAVRLNKPSIALGDLLGSVIANSTFILGIGSLINPIKAEITTIFIASLFFVLTAYLFVIFMHISKKLTLAEGVGLVIIYILFIIVEFYIKAVTGVNLK